MSAPTFTNGTNGHQADIDVDTLYAFWPSPQPAPPPCPEAAFSLTLRGTLDGIESLLTIRGQTAAEFTANLAAIRGLLDQPQPTPQASSQAQDRGKEWCSTHGIQMRQTTKDGRSWYSHYDETAGRWCKGR
jgi:hypothetical protein